MKKYKSLLLLTGAVTSVVARAANPAQPFLPSDNVQDPNCTPIDSNCYVALGGSVGSVDLGNYILATNDLGTSLFAKTSVINGLDNSIFLGSYAGSSATNANNSNFLGQSAGQGATNASLSNFIGQSAGFYATGAYSSNFLGNSAGNGAINANNSLFLGSFAGYFDTVDNTSGGTSIAIGQFSGTGGYSDSIAIGRGVINSATTQLNLGNAIYANGIYNSDTQSSSPTGAYVGINNNAPGYTLDVAGDINFTGTLYQNGVGVGTGAFALDGGGTLYSSNTSAEGSYNFQAGTNAGSGATNANSSNFIGTNAGSGATDANSSNFFGNSAGNGASNSYLSNFFGESAGQNVTNASFSNFLGANAGYGATNANSSNFLGYSAGNGAINANNSLFLGSFAGLNDAVDNSSGGTSIAIGQYSGTGGYSDSIAIGRGVTNSAATQLNIGNVLYGTGIYASDTQSSAALSGGKLGVGIAVPLDRLQVFGDVRVGTTGTNGCLKNFAGTGLTGTCSSDERLKTDITDFATGTLDRILALRVVSYKWNDIAKNLNNVNTQVTNYGLLAQNVEGSFPELVSTDSDGYKQVDYSRIQLYVLRAVQELARKVVGIFDGTGDINAKKIKSQELCVGNTCVTEDQLKALLQGQSAGSQQQASTPTITPTPSLVDQASSTPTVGTTVSEVSISEPAADPVTIPTVETPPEPIIEPSVYTIPIE